jgi:hypothetical protein
MSRRAWAGAACLLFPVLGAASGFGLNVYIDRRPTDEEVRQNNTGARLEPSDGCYLGAFIDLDNSLGETYKDGTGRIRRMPDQFEEKTGKSHASYFFYMQYGTRLPADWITVLGMKGKAVHIALEPNLGLDKVEDNEYLTNLATQLRDTGTPIFIRFASEMNGPWVAYNGDPKKYREKFSLVADKMHKIAPNVAMVWCPYTTPENPILSYYPGDESVDWVGVNFYSVTYYNQDRKTPGAQDHPTDKLDYIYDHFSHKKPIMIGEFGATHYSALEKKSVEDFARGCIISLYSGLPRAYPRVKAIFYFNGNNMEVSHRLNNNYAVTQSPMVLEAYRKVVSIPYFLAQGPGEMWAHHDPEVALPAVRPMAVKSGDTVSGIINISGWARVHGLGYALRFLVNGKGIHYASDKADWSIFTNTAKLPNGPAVLTVELLKSGKRVERRSVTVQVKN